MLRARKASAAVRSGPTPRNVAAVRIVIAATSAVAAAIVVVVAAPPVSPSGVPVNVVPAEPLAQGCLQQRLRPINDAPGQCQSLLHLVAKPVLLFGGLNEEGLGLDTKEQQQQQQHLGQDTRGKASVHVW